MKVEVNGKAYPVRFGYGALKQLCKVWKCNTISGLDKYFKKMEFSVDAEPTIIQLDILGEIVLAGIVNANGPVKVKTNDVLDVILSQPDVIVEVMAEFADSMPKGTDDVNPESRGK